MEGMFSQARKAGLDMDALGDQLRTRKEELIATYKAGGLAKPTPTTFVEATIWSFPSTPGDDRGVRRPCGAGRRFLSGRLRPGRRQTAARHPILRARESRPVGYRRRTGSPEADVGKIAHSSGTPAAQIC
ncbi:MAG: hemerythrin [Sphingomonas bacterium]|uniref:hypothetical protein n=1 Tax=Sphingomonas bacterium TaxID=1895847 RepID=UPI002616B643|nr:hypothetical protein [Sphingomonas bacterium]MDB5705468.1 hemerythrin [Sphingomonas bacterium]